jgi:hypothetical protein
VHVRPRSLLLPLLLIAAVAPASPSRASELDWEGTLAVDVGDFPGGVAWTGTGVATVNDSAGGSALETLRVDPLPFPTTGGYGELTFVVPTHPLVAGPFKTMAGFSDAGFAGGTLAGFSGGGPLGGVPVGGIWVGSGQPDCFHFTRNEGRTGFGVGGSHISTRRVCAPCPTPDPTPLMFTPVRLSIYGAPWTLGTVTVDNSGHGFGPVFATTHGFLHGPASNTSTAALAGAVLQLVTPMQVRMDSVYNSGSIGYFGKLTLRFLPEPKSLLLVGSGVVGLALMGWRRARW